MLNEKSEVDFNKVIPLPSVASKTDATGQSEVEQVYSLIMDLEFAEQNWGTQHNAYTTYLDDGCGEVWFETTWNFPLQLIIELSKRFPNETLSLSYAEPNDASHCGELELKNGKVILHDCAENWESLSANEKARWSSFASELHGYYHEDIEEE